MTTLTVALLHAFPLAEVSFSQQPQVDSCDVTWLWPVPTTLADVDRLLNMADLTTGSGDAIWSDQAFDDLLAVVDGDASRVRVSDAVSHKIEFNQEFRNRGVWKIVGMRVDPTAPGGHADLRNLFGENPQIRLIIQPIITNSDQIIVHDVAVHLVFTYLSGIDGRKALPNREKFKLILDDFLAIKKRCAERGIDTTGAKLGVHPGLAGNSVAGLRESVQTLLADHLAPDQLSAMAIMGIQSPEPWIFVAMFRNGPNDHFKPLPIPVFTDLSVTNSEDKTKTAQMLSFRSNDQPHVMPVPQTNNCNPLTANLTVPKVDRRGVSTAIMFESEFAQMKDQLAVIGTDVNKQPVFDDTLKNSDIADFVANPHVSHFFNTDCVSCHVESQRRAEHKLATSSFAFQWPNGVAVLDPEVAQRDIWNVRNLGWFPDFLDGGNVKPTISQRTANETAEVVDFINREYLGK